MGKLGPTELILVAAILLPLILIFLVIRWIRQRNANKALDNFEGAVSSPAVKTNVLSIIGIVSSLIAMFTGLGLLGYIGMTLGIIGLVQIRKTIEKGKRIAIGAIVIGSIYGIGMSILHKMGYK